MEKLKKLWKLFYTFVKIGGFTLGGGYAMIPIIQREAVDIKKWATEDEMTDLLTLAQSMPGVIGINSATALGSKVAGVPGAIAATLGMVTPSIVIIVLIAAVFDEFQKYELVQKAFVGVRAAIVALMLNAVIRLFKSAVKDIFQIILFICAMLCIAVFSFPPQYVLIVCAASAIAYNIIRSRKGGVKA